jgi:hypothetical protein
MVLRADSTPADIPMEILKGCYYVFAYTIKFVNWLVVGRVAVLLLAGERRNIVVDFFVRFTQPLYTIVKKLFPFTRVPPEKQGTGWGHIDGLVPFVTIALLWSMEKLFRIILSVILLNHQP